jgi:hypothetical protein
MRGTLLPVFMGLTALCACQEYSVFGPDREIVEVASPNGQSDDGLGDPPDWSDCMSGFVGSYTNLSSSHAALEDPSVTPDDPREVDWWDEVDFERYDPSLDFGATWWPIDEGLEGDPEHYVVRWRGWIRAYSATDLQLVLGVVGDAWILLDQEVRHVVAAQAVFEPETVTLSVPSGQIPIDVRYAHRGGDSGFRLRVTGGDLIWCYPEL